MFNAKMLTDFDSAGKCCFAALACRSGLGRYDNGADFIYHEENINEYTLRAMYLGLLWRDLHDVYRRT